MEGSTQFEKIALPISLLTTMGACVSVFSPPPEGCRPVYSERKTSASISKVNVNTPQSWEVFRLDKDHIYAASVGEIVEIAKLKDLLEERLNETNQSSSPLDFPTPHSLLQIDIDDPIHWSLIQPTISQASISIGVTPITVIGSLVSIETMLDDLMNRANSAISSALFAMRGHVSATIADLDVIFRDRMQDAYDKFTEAERRALDRAQAIAVQALESLKKLQEEGFAAASDAICQTTASLANYPNTAVGLGLPIERCFAPDLLCLTQSHNIRDTGSSQAEQLLQFRGVNLLPNGEYPDAKILTANTEFEVPTAGGKSVLHVPLPGGLNGKANDVSLRGNLSTRIEFNWTTNRVNRRWFFELKPYVVRSLEIEIIPLIQGPVRSFKDQKCGVKAEGGNATSREENATCTITVDSGKRVERCEEKTIISRNGEARITNRNFTVGACQWSVKAKSESGWGSGAWIEFIARMHQISDRRISGTPHKQSIILNQNQDSHVVTYPQSLVPDEYEIITGQYSYNVHYINNIGKSTILTESNPSNEVGSALMEGHRLTISLSAPQ